LPDNKISYAVNDGNRKPFAMEYKLKSPVSRKKNAVARLWARKSTGIQLPGKPPHGVLLFVGDLIGSICYQIELIAHAIR
jgi:hypothetical protein